MAGGAIAPEDRQGIIDRIVAASAKVTIERAGQRIGTGSGVVVASRTEGPMREPVTYVLTAAHVIDGKDAAEIFVRFAGANASRGKMHAAVARRGNPDRLDLAILRVTGLAVLPARFPKGDQAQLGEEILVAGFPWGKRFGLFSGIVSQVPEDGKESGTLGDGNDPTIMVDAAVANGVSGGGVFRAVDGGLVGIVEGYQTASIAVRDSSRTYSVKVPMPSETFVVPLSRIRRFLDEGGLDSTAIRPGDPTGRKE